MASCRVAKRKFHTPMSGSMKWATLVIAHEIGAG